MSERYSHLQDLHLADKSTDGSKAIEILVGLDYYFWFITGEVIKVKYGEPVALKSSFGYILSGKYKNHWTVNFNETHSVADPLTVYSLDLSIESSHTKEVVFVFMFQSEVTLWI